MINHLNITYFLEICKEKSFTGASRRLYVSQQSLSNRISALEKELGVLLFERTNPLRLTYAGKVFQRYAQNVVLQKKQLLHELEDIKDDKSGEITIGITHTRGRILLPKIIPMYKEKFPNINVAVFEGSMDEITRRLENGCIDIAIGHMQNISSDIISEKICREEVILIISKIGLKRFYPKNHEDIMKDLNKGKVGALAKYPFLLNKEGDSSRHVADYIFRHEGIKPNIAIETENIETLIELCIGGLGAAFYPDLLLTKSEKKLIDKSCHIFHLDYKNIHIDLSTAYNKKYYMSGAMKELISLLKALMENGSLKSLDQG